MKLNQGGWPTQAVLWLEWGSHELSLPGTRGRRSSTYNLINMARKMDYAETAAQRVLEAVLPGKMKYQCEQSHGECDFELRYDNGTIAAVEVTSSQDRTYVETVAALRKRGNVVPAVKCKQSWMVFPNSDANINKIRAKIDGCLFEVEQMGASEFRWLRGPQCALDLCFDLKINSGSVFPTDGAPQIFISGPGGGGAVGANLAIEAGEKEASKDDNRKKLGASGATEHHLAVYIDVSNGLLWVALTDFQPPTTLPKLPQEITFLWLVGHGRATDEFVIWRAGVKEPWCSRRVVIPTTKTA
jgi:hypothetical protein